MDERAAVLGLAILAGLAWALSPGLHAFRAAVRPAGVAVYADGDPGGLFWSPEPVVPVGPGGLDGRALGPDGKPVGAVGGWLGLLLGTPLDLNRATREDLEALPGVGPKTAEGVLRERARRGSFRSVADLLAVSGIGPETLERLRPFVRVGGLDFDGIAAPASPP